MACHERSRSSIAYLDARIFSGGLYAVCVVLAVLESAFGAGPTETVAPHGKTDFARDIQPLLATNCVRCHGPQTAEAGLRLDDRRSALGKLESGNHAIAPGRPNESEIIRRVISINVSEQMPQKG